jgi:hypothetical protein
LFTPSLDPVRAVMPLSWLNDPKLPRRVLAGVISILLMALGYSAAEVKGVRAGKDAEVEALLRVRQPVLESRVLTLELKMASVEGTTKRIEDKVNESDQKLDEIKTVVTRAVAILGVIEKQGGR